MNLVNEQDIVFFQIGEQCGQVLGFFQHRAAGLSQVHAQLLGNDVAQGGLAQARRPKQQHVVQGFLAIAGRANEDFKLFAHLGLAHVFLQQLGAQGAFDGLFFRADRGGRHHARRGCEIIGLNAHVAKAFKACLMPSLTPMSDGSCLKAAEASLSE